VGASSGPASRRQNRSFVLKGDTEETDCSAASSQAKNGSDRVGLRKCLIMNLLTSTFLTFYHEPEKRGKLQQAATMDS
jgi:hypothetical protein